ncbi:hypothetical protein BVRB_3g060060 [Beta vulgaris subsp. vulgaris]|nr:hypothetical protein BVRB_3g060060 [Beta vulgaris subsp. vulgaris]
MHHNTITFLLVILLYLATLNLVTYFPLTCRTFNQSVFGDFLTPADDSFIFRKPLQVTQDKSDSIFNLCGKVLHKQQFTLLNQRTNASFNSVFALNIRSKNERGGEGGEGLAFILATDRELPNNNEGQWQGIVDGHTQWWILKLFLLGAR